MTTARPYPVWHPMTDMDWFERDGITIAEGDGVHVWDTDGREYLSATAGLWNVACGFGHPDIIRAVTDQLERLSYGTLFRFGNEPAIQLAARLLKLAPGDLTRVFYSGSGAAANEAAVKILWRWYRLTGQPERRLVVSLDRSSWHGTGVGAQSLTGEDIGQEEYLADLRHVRKVPPPGVDDPDGERCIAALEDLVAREGDRLAAVVVEPVIGSGGVFPLPAALFRYLEGLRDRHGVALIADEVATGFGRTGRMFACEWHGFTPDVLVVSKAVTSGYLPLAATLFHERYPNAFREHRLPLLHGETQAGNPAACAAALATLDVVDREGLVDNSAKVGAHLLERLTPLTTHPHVNDVRGLGLMLGIDLAEPGEPAVPLSPVQLFGVIRLLEREGLIVHPAPQGISLFPPLTLETEDADRIADILTRVLGRITIPARTS